MNQDAAESKKNDREQRLILLWSEELPEQITDVYMPVFCLLNRPDKKIFLAAYRMDESKVIIVVASGAAAEDLRAESDVMDLLVLTCIPRKIGFYEEGRSCVLVREYVVGESLNGALVRNGIFSEDQVRGLTTDVCLLLKELYDRHLTVAPKSIVAQNILVTDDGRMKLVEPEGIYFSDENGRGWEKNAAAVGILMCFMLTGSSVLNKETEKKLSPSMKKIIRRCLQPAEYRRFVSPGQLMTALEQAMPRMVRKKQMAFAVLSTAVMLAGAIIILPFTGISKAPVLNDNSGRAIAEEELLVENGIPAGAADKVMTEPPKADTDQTKETDPTQAADQTKETDPAQAISPTTP